MSIASVAFGFATALIVYVLCATYIRSRVYRWAGLVALCGHFAAGIVVIHILRYTWDIQEFHRVAQHVLRGVTLNTNPTVNSFGGIQALFYAIYGANPLIVSAVNGLLAVSIPVFTGILARKLYPSVTDVDGVTLVVLFAPLSFLYMSIPMRDTLAIVLFFAILAAWTLTLAESRYGFSLSSVPLWGALYLLRPELGMILLLGLGAAVLVHSFNSIAIRDLTVPTLLGIVTPVGIMGFLYVFRNFPLSSVNRKVAYRARGGAAYLESMQYQGICDVILAAPVRAVYFQFAPFPLHATSIFDFLAVAILPGLIFVAVAAYRSLLAVQSETPILALLLTVYVTGVVGYGLIDSNFGTTVRHRIPLTFLLLIFAAPVLQEHERSLRRWLRKRTRQNGNQHKK